MNKKIFALALGTFCLGMAEYVMMSILPEVAQSLKISISDAGQLISSYAIGVGVGAPLVMVFARNYPLKKLLMALVGIMILGNFLTAISPNFNSALISRFISGVPHGSFFGVGLIVANKLSAPGKQATSVALMVMGMTIANLFGVPFANFASLLFSWRIIFFATVIFSIITLIAIKRFIPEIPPLPRTNIKGLFRFLKKPAPWLLIATAIFSSGGIFCLYSYINPFMTEASGINIDSMPMIMLVSGLGMCIGNYCGGYFSDKFNPSIVTSFIVGTSMVTLLLMYAFSSFAFITIPLLCVASACLFGYGAPLQQLLLRYAAGGELMGGALAQLAFNFGNALGAFVGGASIAYNYHIANISLLGSFLSCGGLIVMILFTITIFSKRTNNL